MLRLPASDRRSLKSAVPENWDPLKEIECNIPVRKWSSNARIQRVKIEAHSPDHQSATPVSTTSNAISEGHSCESPPLLISKLNDTPKKKCAVKIEIVSEPIDDIVISRTAHLRPQLYVDCFLCGEKFDNVSILLHLQRHFHTSGLLRGKANAVNDCPNCLRSLSSGSKKHGKLICPIDSVTRSKARHPTYECPLCMSFKTKSYRGLFNHYVDSHRFQHDIMCKYCLQVFGADANESLIASSKRLCQHIQDHFTLPKYPCHYCRLVFTDPEVYRLHRYIKHKSSGKFGHVVSQKTRFTGRALAQHIEEMRTYNITNNTNIFKFAKSKLEASCLECCVPFNSNVMDHFALHYSCKLCSFQSNCFVAAQAHGQLKHPKEMPCKSTTLFAKRTRELVRRGKLSNQCVSEGLKCHCSYFTRDAEAMIVHLTSCNYSSARIQRSTKCTARYSSHKAVDSVKIPDILKYVGLTCK